MTATNSEDPDFSNGAWYVHDTETGKLVERCDNWDAAADNCFDRNEAEGANRYAPRSVHDERNDLVQE